MAVSNEDNLKRVHGDGTTPTIGFLFRVLNSSDLKVSKILLSTGVSVELTEGVDYNVTLEDDGQGGNVIFTASVSALYDILIVNILDLTQTAELPVEGNFNETSVETALDHSILIDIQQQEQINRCLKLNTEDPLNVDDFTGFFLGIDTAVNRAGKLIVFNDAGDGLETGPDSTDVSTVAANIPAINTVSANIASVNTCAANIASINTVAANIAGMNNLAALAAIATTGIYTRTGAGTASARTITGTADQIILTNGNGVAGNPTISLPSGIQFGVAHTFTSSNNAIIGGVVNTAAGTRNAIIGGLSNNDSSSGGVILGGSSNTNSGTGGIISGNGNTNSSNNAFIGGGTGHNISSGSNAAIIGGDTNTATGTDSFVGSGSANSATASNSAVVGGTSNSSGNNQCVIIGGSSNLISGTAAAATDSGIFSGTANVINTTSGQQNAIISGASNNITGSNAEGNVILGGLGNVIASPAFGCVAMGEFAKADKSCQFVRAAGDFSAVGDAQGSSFISKAKTTTATQTEMLITGSSRMTMADDTTWAFHILITARRTDADNESAAYLVTGAIDRNAGTVALVAAINKTVIAEDTAAWDVDVQADNTNKALIIKVTGEAGKTIQWVADIRTAETTG